MRNRVGCREPEEILIEVIVHLRAFIRLAVVHSKVSNRIIQTFLSTIGKICYFDERKLSHLTIGDFFAIKLRSILDSYFVIFIIIR